MMQRWIFRGQRVLLKDRQILFSQNAEEMPQPWDIFWI